MRKRKELNKKPLLWLSRKKDKEDQAASSTILPQIETATTSKGKQKQTQAIGNKNTREDTPDSSSEERKVEGQAAADLRLAEAN
jgi:hypothetical protein